MADNTVIKGSEWIAYNELAWVDMIISSPEDFKKESERYCALIREQLGNKPGTILHLGCGAGMNDYFFKRHFAVTGIDISRGMLEAAGRLNPEVEYMPGDMRTLALGRQFDAVVCPESIGYMTTLRDLRQAIKTAARHLKPDGTFIVGVHVREEFRENNFAYSGRRGNTTVTVFENNHYPDRRRNIYEATIVYLIRRSEELEMHGETHLIGLFSEKTWLNVLEKEGFRVKMEAVKDAYRDNILGEGSYPVKIYVCTRQL